MFLKHHDKLPWKANFPLVIFSTSLEPFEFSRLIGYIFDNDESCIAFSHEKI